MNIRDRDNATFVRLMREMQNRTRFGSTLVRLGPSEGRPPTAYQVRLVDGARATLPAEQARIYHQTIVKLVDDTIRYRVDAAIQTILSTTMSASSDPTQIGLGVGDIMEDLRDASALPAVLIPEDTQGQAAVGLNPAWVVRFSGTEEEEAQGLCAALHARLEPIRRDLVQAALIDIQQFLRAGA